MLYREDAREIAEQALPQNTKFTTHKLRMSTELSIEKVLSWTDKAI